MIPSWLPSSSITRISRARMRSLVRIKRLSIQSSEVTAVFQKYSMGCRESSAATESGRRCQCSLQRVSSYAVNGRRQALIRLVPSLQEQLQIIIGECLGVLAVAMSERDGLHFAADKRLHERLLFRGGEFPQYAV